MSKATIYKDLKSKEPHGISIEAALDRIKRGKSGEIVDKIRGGEDLKTSLPCVIFSGRVVGDTRKDEDVVQHSGFIILDFDHVDPEVKKAQLKKDSYIFAAWVSPSGDGVKALVKCPPNLDKHGDYYNALLSRYPELDPSGRNIARLCFESSDEDLYYNPKSLVWDRAISDEEAQEFKNKQKSKIKKRILNIAVSMISNSKEGERHTTILKASNLCGGYDKHFDGDEAIIKLEEAVRLKGFNPRELPTELKAVRDGYEHGKNMPIHDLKEIEKSSDYNKREDGTYDFMADDEEMDDYEFRVMNGLLEMGLSTGIPRLDQHWMFKRNTLVWMGGISNIGKSFGGWYKSVLVAMLHGWKGLIYSKENRDGQVRKKLKEFYVGKSIKLFTPEEKQMADEFIKTHFRMFTAKKSHTITDFLLKCEIVYDEGWEYDFIFAEPYNSFNIPLGTSLYPYNTYALNELQTFKENYTAVWISDHVGSDAARNRDKDGFIKVPWKSDIEMGAMKDNKSDDFLIYHRHTQDPARKMITEIHVQKVKDKETGGEPTPHDEPIELIANPDLCGFSCDGVDPVKEYWQRRGRVQQPTPVSSRLKPHPVEDTEAPF